MVKNNEKSKKKQEKVIATSGKAFISAGFNNTVVTITDTLGNALFAGSAGAAGFKGSRKSTPYAATKATEAIAQKATTLGMREVAVFVKGPGLGRIPAIKALKTGGLNVISITDTTPMPHNGCRPRKKRRV